MNYKNEGPAIQLPGDHWLQIQVDEGEPETSVVRKQSLILDEEGEEVAKFFHVLRRYEAEMFLTGLKRGHEWGRRVGRAEKAREILAALKEGE